MKRNFKKAVLISAAVLMVITTFTACDMGLPWDIEVWGEWLGDNTDYGSDEDTVITITNKTITIDMPEAWVWDYEGEIVEYNNDNFNIASENPSSGDYGYLIFKITDHENESDYAQAEIGKYAVVRWKELTETSLKYSESSTQFDTLEEAAEASSEDYFSSYSTLTKSED